MEGKKNWLHKSIELLEIIWGKKTVKTEDAQFEKKKFKLKFELEV